MTDSPLFDLFLILFIGMGPVKGLLIYLGITQGASRDVQRKVAQKAVLTAAVVALVLLVAGVIFMRLLHFSAEALTIAGGVILLLLALNLVLSPGEAHGAEPPSEEQLLSIAMYPLGIPLILNPVGIVYLTVASAETQELLQFGVIVLMVILVAAIDYGILLASHRLDKYLTPERILVMEKLLGILLAALATQMILNGLSDLGIITMTGAH